MALQTFGVMIPIFSLRSHQSWGIGEIDDLVPFATWMKKANFSLLQILPVMEALGSTLSPYASVCAFGIDPIYISMQARHQLPLLCLQVACEISKKESALLSHLQQSKTVNYKQLRPFKMTILRRAFEYFSSADAALQAQDTKDFTQFCQAETNWLDTYTLFRSLQEIYKNIPWWNWPVSFRNRNKHALQQFRQQYQHSIRFWSFVQWVAHHQWRLMRKQLDQIGVELMGDLPFSLIRNSADVWANRNLFLLNRNLGAPPDQFNRYGQDWGLPAFAWSCHRRTQFSWMKRRIEYASLLFSHLRIDHVLGFYRSYTRSQTEYTKRRLPLGTFSPKTPLKQKQQGEEILSTLFQTSRKCHLKLIAEDLGAVPDYVPESLKRMHIPGHKVFIWQKCNAQFIDPKQYPLHSLACLGTHDTETIAVWWEQCNPKERQALQQLYQNCFPSADIRIDETKYNLTVHTAIIKLLCRASSELIMLRIQDIFALRERINIPGTVGPHNWSFRLPIPVEKLEKDSTWIRYFEFTSQMIETKLRSTV